MSPGDEKGNRITGTSSLGVDCLSAFFPLVARDVHERQDGVYAHALVGQKKYADAEPLLLKGYEGMKKRDKTISPANNDCLTKSLDRLIELYTATNKPDELKKWKAERAKYPVESNPAAKSAPMPMKKK